MSNKLAAETECVTNLRDKLIEIKIVLNLYHFFGIMLLCNLTKEIIMRTKSIKIALCVLMLVVAVILATSYVSLTRFAQDLLDQLKETDTDMEATQVGTLVVALFVCAPMASSWWLVTITFVVMSILLLCAKKPSAMRQRVKILFIFDIVYTVILFISMMFCWVVAIQSALLTALLLISDVGFVSCFVLTVVLRNYVRDIPDDDEDARL